MTPALERLSELVRQAEAKTRARKIEAEAQHAAEQFRAAELRAAGPWKNNAWYGRTACVRSSRPMPTSSCSRSWCANLPSDKSSLGSEADAERLIAASQAEIERTRQQSRGDLDEVVREVEEARREFGQPPTTIAIFAVSLTGCSLIWWHNS